MSALNWYELKLRVPYDAIDMMQIVYHGRYLVWFELARVEYTRSLGIAFKDLVKRGFATAMAEIKMDFQAPARFDDEIVVKTRIGNVGASSVRFECEIEKISSSDSGSKHLLCSGYAILVLVDRSGKPVQIPPDVVETLSIAHQR